LLSTTTVTEFDVLLTLIPVVAPVQVTVELLPGLATVPLPEVTVQVAHAVPGTAKRQMAVPASAARLMVSTVGLGIANSLN
jgi:hypothetical protein